MAIIGHGECELKQDNDEREPDHEEHESLALPHHALPKK